MLRPSKLSGPNQCSLAHTKAITSYLRSPNTRATIATYLVPTRALWFVLEPLTDTLKSGRLSNQDTFYGSQECPDLGVPTCAL